MACCKLNTVTIQDSYPILPIDEGIDSLISATIFSTQDANINYWQGKSLIKIAKKPLSHSTTDYSDLYE